MANKERILVVEDEANIAGFITAILEANDYEVLTAQSGREAMMQVTSYCPDAVILDLGLPDMDGQNIIKFVREWSQVPILVVSARTHERDKISALDLGADDYVAKPFFTGELLARLRAALRRSKQRASAGVSQSESEYRCESLVIDFGKRRVFLNGADVHVTQIEYRILSLLAENAGRVLTYDYIIKNIWGPNAASDTQILRVNMANIRRKIEVNPAAPQYLHTEIGVGYWITENQ